jgi:hypothetical protein
LINFSTSAAKGYPQQHVGKLQHCFQDHLAGNFVMSSGKQLGFNAASEIGNPL